MFSCLMSSLLLPTLVGASILKTEKQQIKSQEQLPEKSYGINKQGYGPDLHQNGYGYGPIDKNLEANGYGYAFAYGHDKEKDPKGNAYGLNKEKPSYGYGYGQQNIPKQKKVNIFTNVFSKIRNIFSFWKVK